jgi:ubiquinone/menaquinone biosynthesis C-methylase UbiE
MAANSEQQTQFWSRIAPRYDRGVDVTIGPKARPKVRQRLAAEGRLGRVVEFGCGTGFQTGVLAEHADELLATDLSPGMIEVARGRVRAANVKFDVQDVQHTTLPDASVDTCVLGLVIHFTNPARTLAEMRRILKPGGTLIIINPDIKSLTGFNLLRCRVRMITAGLFAWRAKPPKGFAPGVVNEQELRQLLQSAGFKDVQFEVFRDESRSSYIPVQYVRAIKPAGGAA